MTRKLERKVNDSLIAGVCAGIADYFQISPMVVRAAFVFFGFVSGGMCIFIYIVLAIALPRAKKSQQNFQTTNPPFNPNQYDPQQYRVTHYETKHSASTVTQNAPSQVPYQPAGHSTSRPPTTLDVNRASEQELLALPSLTAIECKQIIQARQKRGGFQSAEEVAELIRKPHILSLITVSPVQRNSHSGGQSNPGSRQTSGRRVDY
ncbi:MAG: PspC domain-containing protein [Xenococcaceae cyanobacterium]